MTETIVNSYEKKDKVSLEEIAYRTGFNGEDLTGRNFFDDKRLFFLIYASYYPRYESDHCFVARESQTDAVVGYIIGTPDSTAQEEAFQKRMLWRIALRAFLVTSWCHPRTFGMVLQMWKRSDPEGYRVDPDVLAEYPAHLHINLLPGYQGLGIGTRLIRHFEEHLLHLGVKGVHLQTSNYNRKAIPFYRKLGYSIIRETRGIYHPLFDDFTLLAFAKRLEG